MTAPARSWIAWVVVGLVAGWVASLLRGADATAMLQWLIAGLIGAVVGGLIAQQLKLDLRTGNRFLEQVIIAVIGALIVIVVAGLII
jgi:uncharacterized membrane protein YeaQ/YmgE (transglycosylase-associated protein family)